MFLAGVKPPGLTVNEYMEKQEDVDITSNYMMFTFNSTYSHLPNTRDDYEFVVVSDPDMICGGYNMIFCRTGDFAEADRLRDCLSENQESHKDYECFIVHFMLLAKLFKEIPYNTPLMGDLDD